MFVLDIFTRAVTPSGISFTPSNNKVLLQDWTSVVLNLMPDEEELAARRRMAGRLGDRARVYAKLERTID